MATTTPDARLLPAALAPLDYGLYALAVFVWGTSWIAVKLQVGPVPAEVSVFWRFVVAAVLMIAWVRISRRPMAFPLSAHLRFAALGLLVFSTNFVMFYHGAQYLPSGLLSVVFSTTSIINMMLAAIIFRQGVSRRVLFAGALGVAGVAAMFWPQIAGTTFDHGALIGLGFCLAGTLSFCLGNMVSVASHARGLPVISANAWGMVYGTVFLGLLCLVAGHDFMPEFTVTYMGALAWLSVSATVIAFATYLTLLSRIGSARAGYATVMFPVVALAISTVAEGYVWTPVAIAGLVLVLAGNMVVLTKGRVRGE